MPSATGSQFKKFFTAFAFVVGAMVGAFFALNLNVEEVHKTALTYVLVPVAAAFVLVSIAIRLGKIGSDTK